MQTRPILITGSLAYDHVMTFPGKFSEHILPDKIHMLNVAFNIDTLQIDLGGTAGNIAYSLSLFGQKPIIHATAGNDFERYKKRLQELGLSTSSIKLLDDEKTAQAFITTDLADNQITAFHVGAMGLASEHSLQNSQLPAPNSQLVIIAPNHPAAMLMHADFCRNNNIDFIFDPGQAFNAFSANDLQSAAKNSLALTVNDYEWQLWQDKTGFNEAKTLELTKAIIVTLGEKGCQLITAEGKQKFPAVNVEKVIDPTGCGDAFRAGLLHGLSQNLNWAESIKIATKVAAACVQAQGPQNHTLN